MTLRLSLSLYKQHYNVAMLLDFHLYIEDWDGATNKFNTIRMMKLLSTDEELREEVIPVHMEMINQLLGNIVFACHTKDQKICVIGEFMSTATDLYSANLLKVGMQGVILAVSDKKAMVVCFVEDMTCRWITSGNYKNILPVPSIRICINEDFTSTATNLYPSTLSLNKVM